MNKKVIIVLAIAIVLLATVAYFGYQYWLRGTPQYSFAQMQLAAKDHDTTTFNKYFDAGSIFDNLWPRARSVYATYLSQSSVSALQRSIAMATFDNQSSTSKQSFETATYDYVIGKSSNNSQSETSKSIFDVMGNKPAFSVNNGTATFSFTYENYGSKNPQNYPVYKFNVVMQQQDDRHWKVVDIQGMEDRVYTTADAIRLNAVGMIIADLVHSYVTTEQRPYLDDNNWQTVLANYAAEQRAMTTFPTDPLSSYGNAYTFAITNADSSTTYEYIIKANLSTITSPAFQSVSYSGFGYNDIIKKISNENNIVLNLDCNSPAFCYPGFGSDSAWAKLLKN